MRILFCTFLLSLAGFAQTTLPTSFDFATAPSTLPTGWSTNTSDNYSSGLLDNNGTTSRAGKLQSTGHYYLIEFFDEPGSVSYSLKSYGTNSFVGQLIVEESVNGSSWNTLHTFNNNDFNDSWSQFTDVPDVDSRFIRFNLVNKVSGTNAGLDDVSISAFSPVDEEINAVYNGNDIPSGTAIQFSTGVGNTKTLSIGIENLGSQGTLNITGSNISGSASSDYSVVSSPSNIQPGNNDSIKIEFTPSSSGNRFTQLSIDNNDSNEDPYIIQLEGIGGNTSTEPQDNPGNLTWETVKTYRLTGSFSPSDAENYLVVFSKSPINFIPLDGVEYENGQGVGNGKVAKAGSGTHFMIREAVAMDSFYVKVFGYNGQDQFTNYKESNPLEGAVKMPDATMIDPNYYSGIDETNSNFVDDLTALINPHFVRFYSNYGPDMVPRFLARDTTNGQRVITGVYSGEHVVYNPPFGWPETGMNREHTLPSSWMPGSSGSGSPQYQDFHHLFPTKAVANSQRSNHPLGKVVNVSNSYLEGKVGTDANGNTVYEPRDEQKGDAARAIFYMQTAYNTGSTSWAFEDLLSDGPNQKLAVLLEWHYNDLPSSFERARNDYLDSLQENRNPFIDSAHWVCYIDFKTMGYIPNPDSSCLEATLPKVDQPIDTTDSTIGIKQLLHPGFELYPNPSNGILFIQSEFQIVDLEIIDTQGRSILRESGVNRKRSEVEISETGIFFLRITDINGRKSHRRVIVQ